MDPALLDSSTRELRGLSVAAEPPGLDRPGPLSPVSVIAGMGGTGSSGLGLASSGPGPGGGFESGPGMGDDDDDRVSGYNESFSTTGWI